MADILIDTQTTDAGGQAAFSNLPPGNYYYVMTNAPAGYTLDSTHYSFTVTTTTPITETRDGTPTNTGTLTVTKHALGHETLLLDGGTFSLKKGAATLVAESGPTVSGLIAFPNLMTMADPSQVTYTVQEVTQPSGYELNPTAYDVPLEIAGSNQLVPDTATVEGSAVVTLEDTYYNAAKLSGAEYDLYIVQ